MTSPHSSAQATVAWFGGVIDGVVVGGGGGGDDQA